MRPISYLALASAFAAAAPAFAQQQVVKIDGSSTVFPITEAVAEEFQKAKKQSIKVTVGISGTGGGFKKFCRGETDISDASRPILKAEMAECAKAGIEYYELPVAFDALTVVINPKNNFIKQLTIAEMKRMWEPAAQGKVTRWNQVNPQWPDQPMKLFGPGADSGTRTERSPPAIRDAVSVIFLTGRMPRCTTHQLTTPRAARNARSPPGPSSTPPASTPTRSGAWMILGRRR